MYCLTVCSSYFVKGSGQVVITDRVHMGNLLDYKVRNVQTYSFGKET